MCGMKPPLRLWRGSRRSLWICETGQGTSPPGARSSTRLNRSVVERHLALFFFGFAEMVTFHLPATFIYVDHICTLA